MEAPSRFTCVMDDFVVVGLLLFCPRSSFFDFLMRSPNCAGEDQPGVGPSVSLPALSSINDFPDVNLILERIIRGHDGTGGEEAIEWMCRWVIGVVERVSGCWKDHAKVKDAKSTLCGGGVVVAVEGLISAAKVMFCGGVGHVSKVEGPNMPVGVTVVVNVFEAISRYISCP